MESVFLGEGIWQNTVIYGLTLLRLFDILVSGEIPRESREQTMFRRAPQPMRLYFP
jgi:hypothetical protein